MDEYDTGEENFNGEKTCLENVSIGNYSLLEGKDRCPNLAEKSIEKLGFRMVLYIFIFIINIFAQSTLSNIYTCNWPTE